MIDRTGQLFYVEAGQVVYTKHATYTLNENLILVLRPGKRENDHHCLILSEKTTFCFVDFCEEWYDDWDIEFIRVA